MAKVKTAFGKRLTTAIKTGMEKAGIPATVEVQKIAGTKLHRVLVLGPKLKKLRPAERQDFVWRIIGASMLPDEQMLISTIRTLTPDEATPIVRSVRPPASRAASG